MSKVKIIAAVILLLFLTVGIGAGVYFGVNRKQDIRSKAAVEVCGNMRWPADPDSACGKATQQPAQGATNVSLTPNFHWDYGGYRAGETTCVQPSGCSTYAATVYLTESGATRPFAVANTVTPQAAPIKDMSFADFKLCDYGHVFPNDPDTCHNDGQPSLTALKPGTTYTWKPTPFFDSIVHAEQTWNYTFTTVVVQVSHKACVDGSCALVPGAGTDTCNQIETPCITINQHLACQNNACVKVNCPGDTACSDDCPNNCQPVQKLECNQICKVDGDCESGFCFVDNPTPPMKRPSISVCRNKACSSETSCVCPVPVAACQKVTASKDLDKIKIGDTVTFTGFGTLTNPPAGDSIDKIEFTILKDGTQVLKQTVNTIKNVAGDWEGSLGYSVTLSGSYSVKIRVHRVSTNTWLE